MPEIGTLLHTHGSVGESGSEDASCYYADLSFASFYAMLFYADLSFASFYAMLF